MNLPKTLLRSPLLQLLLAVLCIFPAAAQELKFNHLGSAQGLSQAVVNTVFQDQRGFMWFATQEGLNKYDGYSFTVLKHNPVDTNSLANSFVNTIFQDKQGNFWVGLHGGGLDMYNEAGGKYKHHANDPKNKFSISNNYVRAIHQDRDGLFWIGTDNGLNLFDPKTGRFTHFFYSEKDPYGISGNQVYDIFEDKNGLIWIGTYGDGLNAANRKPGGLSVYDKRSGRFTSYVMSESEVKRFYETDKWQRNAAELTVKAGYIRCIYEGRDGLFWLGTDGAGILVFDPRNRSFVKVFNPEPDNYHSISGPRVHSIVEDEFGRIWAGTFGKGLSIYNALTGEFERYEADDRNSYGLNHNDVKCLLSDRQGNMWVGTNGGGVNVFFKSMGKFAHIKRSEKPGVGENSLKSDVVMSILEDRDGMLWIGTYGGGVSALDRRLNRYTHYPELSTSAQNVVLSLLEDKDGNIWVGTYGDGINVLDRKTGQVRHYGSPQHLRDGTVMCMVSDKAGNVWAGTYDGGVYKIIPGTDSIQAFTKAEGLSCEGVASICFDKKGNPWFGGIGGGAMYFDLAKNKITVYRHDKQKKNSLSNDLINCVFEDSQGMIWFGTTNGLNRFDPSTGQFSVWYERDGLLSDYIYGIVADAKGYLWLSSNKGITRFDPSVENVDGSAFRNFGVNDGLQRGEFDQGAYFKSKRGEIFFGGMFGLNAFFPDKIMDNSNIPPVYITSYKRFGKEVKLDTNILQKKYIELDWKDNYISFEFTALDFAMPSKNKYQFILEGFDDEWSPPTNNRFASYTNVPGGEYVFRVKAANSEGVWNEEGAQLHIKINPPFWKTNWFYTLCVIVAIGSVFGFIRYRTGAIKKENKVLEARVAERTYELAQKNADITASIEYARRIQFAMLPSLELIFQHLPQSFVLYKPKDIVSGDFYWFAEKGGRKIIVAADCTGHGVPGALMSMIGHNLLNQIVLEKGVTEPGAILTALNEGVRTALKQGEHHEGQDTSDGMDVCLCSIDMQKREVQYAGALRPLVVIRKGLLSKIDSDRYSIGGGQDADERTYTNHKFFLDEGDTLYLFSDGYADQFGGEKGKKFMLKRMQETLLSVQHMDMKAQGEFLDNTIENWRGNFQQVDDILVIGLRL